MILHRVTSVSSQKTNLFSTFIYCDQSRVCHRVSGTIDKRKFEFRDYMSVWSWLKTLWLLKTGEADSVPKDSSVDAGLCYSVVDDWWFWSNCGLWSTFKLQEIAWPTLLICSKLFIVIGEDESFITVFCVGVIGSIRLRLAYKTFFNSILTINWLSSSFISKKKIILFMPAQLV